VVLATGLGKTWLSAFDTVQFQAKRVLFVAHREEILRQALSTFRAILPAATLGLYTGAEKAPEADVLFASIQTLGKAEHLRRFSPRSFDYIIIDEFHHASALTYRRLIDHFEPEFLLGLTATPERTDGGDLLALCGENLVYRCDLVQGPWSKYRSSSPPSATSEFPTTSTTRTSPGGAPDSTRRRSRTPSRP
jgi:superfamily II DNA or RNA helicase